MYTVDLYRRVRRTHFVEGMSIREVARMFDLHRNTVNKMLEYSVPPGYQRQHPRRRTKLDYYTPTSTRSSSRTTLDPRSSVTLPSGYSSV